MKKLTLYSIFGFWFLTGCTQVVTAPIYVAGAVATTTIDVAGAAVDAAIPDGDDEEDED